jgi:putative ABC transport system substrate-binding protein
LRKAEEACRAAAVDLYVKEVPTAGGLEPAFAELTRARVQGVIVLNHPVFTVNKDRVMALAAKNRLPAIYEYSSWPESGGLMSYGAVFTEIYRQLAECVDKVLRGAKPIDLPVQQSSKFELVINLKSARALGLAIPRSVLLQANRVIE